MDYMFYSCNKLTKPLRVINACLFSESIWFCLFLFLAFVIYKIYNRHGQLFFSYFIGYGIIRFFVEALRTDSLMIGPLRMAQLTGVAGAVSQQDTVVYTLSNTEMTIPLKAGADGKVHYAVGKVSLSINSTHEDYATYYTEDFSSAHLYITSAITHLNLIKSPMLFKKICYKVAHICNIGNIGYRDYRGSFYKPLKIFYKLGLKVL